MPNYTNGKIYKLESLSTGLVYIGSTTQSLSARKNGHKKDYRLYLQGARDYITSFKVLAEGDAEMYLLEEYSCESKEQLYAREGYWVKTLSCVNKAIPGRTPKEWKFDNKDIIKIKDKEYRLKNKKLITENKKIHYSKNKDIILAQCREYRGTHKEERKRNNSTIIKCECGASMTKNTIARHRKRKVHSDNLEKQKRLHDAFLRFFIINIYKTHPNIVIDKI